jgi:protein O-mannosyl-transferase
MSRRDRTHLLLTSLVIIIAGLLVYAELFDARRQFTAYDDNAYVTSQPLVEGFRVGMIPKIFEPSTTVASNYHPLTVLSLGIDHALFGPSARAMGLVNLALHIITSLLVLALLRRLLQERPWLPEIGALWFAIHPLHVESVAWVSGRKDVLYGLWFVASLLCYIRYIDQSRRVMLLAAFGAFVLSCLSKPSAVVLPLVLVLVDIARGRGITLKTMAEKAPFLVASLIIGIITVRAQTAAGAVADEATFSVLERIVIAGYGFVMYWVHMIWPVGLNAFYPYPSVNNVFTLPWYAYAMPLLAASMVMLPWLMRRRSITADAAITRSTWSTIAFGTGWFAITIILVLQLVSVGMVIMADRYSYIPMIGMLCVILTGLDLLLQRQRIVGWMIVIAFTVLQGVQTYQQAGMWRNTETIWTSILERTGNTGTADEVVRANLSDGYVMIYVLRGIHYFEANKPEQSYADLRHIMNAESPRTDAYERLGLLAGMMGKIDESIAAYTVAISRPDASADAYLNRGIGYLRTARPDDARRDFEMGLTKNPLPEIQARLERFLR